MPELPEVETIVRELRPHVLGAMILDATVDWARILAHPAEDIEAFRRGVRGRRIDDVWRRGKFIVLTLSGASPDGGHLVGARRDTPADNRPVGARRDAPADNRPVGAHYDTPADNRPVGAHHDTPGDIWPVGARRDAPTDIRPVGARRDAPASQLAAGGPLSLLIHLRMSGRLTLAPGGRPEHLRIHFALSTGSLYFYCQRKFGRVWVVDDPQRVLAGLGPEPLSAELTLARFAGLLSHRRGMIKPLLLNQRFLAGLGNIYVDEALYRARLHPCRTADTLGDAEVERIYHAIRAVLRQALEHRGTSFDGIFVRPQGEEGRQQEGLLVYGQAGEPCARCGTPIERIVVGGRGTHVCPYCQQGPHT